ncbi:MAG: hypothetical protein AAF975_07340, partial [Spirochaetota bacterium]
RFGRVRTAIQDRIEGKNEDWLIIVTTDHGRGLSAAYPNEYYRHGGQSIMEKTIFVASNKDLPEFRQYASSPLSEYISGYEELYRHLPQTAIAPAILRYLGIPAKAGDFLKR